MYLLGNLEQVPPASGNLSLVIHPDFQTIFEFIVLRENRRQEKNPEYGKILDLIKRGCAERCSEPSGTQSLAESVRDFFIEAYVRGFGVSGATVDLETGVALTSLRHHKERWCEEVKRIEEFVE